MQKNWLVISLNKKYFLKVGNKVFGCQIGEGGLKIAKKKIEGDKTTPIGKWRLETIFYRPDKILRPKFKKKNILKINKITRNCGWCDDIRSNKYNSYIKINNFQTPILNYEKLWREDEAYDIIISISHNLKPTIKNKGSAIFIHVAKRNYSPTLGCIAVSKKNIIDIVASITKKSYITIS